MNIFETKRMHLAVRTAVAILGLFLLMAAAAPSLGLAQPALTPAGKEEAAPATPPVPSDPLGRETPEGFVTGLLKAMADQDYERAARYLDLSAVPEDGREKRGAELARELQQLLDKAGWVSANWQLSRDSRRAAG